MTLKTLREQIDGNIAIYDSDTMSKPMVISSKCASRYDSEKVINLFLFMDNIIGIEVE